MPGDIAIAHTPLKKTRPSSHELTKAVLEMVLQYRRIPSEQDACANHQCEPCFDQYRDRIQGRIRRNEPIVFVLPAFPGKSPNPAKVLGKRADMAEEQSLRFLDSLCRRIEKVYSPGARLLLCSDGRVFNDVVGIEEADITTYQHDLTRIIESLGANSLSTFNLDNVYVGHDFETMRTQLMNQYGERIESVHAAVAEGGDALRMYRGITRFLFEDALRPQMTISKTALQKQCRPRAYEVIRRSRAWDALLAERFPDAIRLSIHPQVCGGRKIGIHLMETKDAWLTAWHSVAVEIAGKYRLMRRQEIERLGGEIVFRDGRTSHFVALHSPEEISHGL